MSRQTKFTAVEWHYTQANENLLDLPKPTADLYRLIIKEVRR